MNAATETNAADITVNEMAADAIAARHMLGFLKDYLAFHLHEAKTDEEGRVVQFNARCVRMIHAALETALREGAECGEHDIAEIIAGDFFNE